MKEIDFVMQARRSIFPRALAFKKNNSKGARYFNAAANERFGRDVYDHLTGSVAQSLMCLLPIFYPDGVVQNPLDFSPFYPVGFKDEI